MNKPQLMNNVEKMMLAIIAQQEEELNTNPQSIDLKNYLKLADLYHFDKEFKKEAAILSRFVDINKDETHDLMDIYSRIERATQLAALVVDNPEPVEIKKYKLGKTKLALEPVSDDEELVVEAPKQKIMPRVDGSKPLFHEKAHMVLTVYGVCTGRSDHDEIIQLALELFRYDPLSDKPMQIIETFVGLRKTQVKIPNDIDMKFNLSQINPSKEPFDTSKIISLFEQADFAVSHDNADVVRKLLATLIPEVAEKPWYATQKDIPWTALGFKSNRFTQLAVDLKERAPRTSLERVVILGRILQKKEINSEQTYLERLYNMQPMKAFNWTPELTKQQNKLKNAKLVKRIKLSVGLVVAVSIAVFLFI